MSVAFFPRSYFTLQTSYEMKISTDFISYPKGVEYAVPDAAVDVSYKTLANVGFRPCSRSLECVFANAEFSPQSSAHLHIDDKLAIMLHRQSDILWDFPPLDFKIIDVHHGRKPDYATRSDQIWCASDPRLIQSRSGPFLPDSVHIPSPARYCEALILLMCRDFMLPRKSHWSSHLSYYFDYIEEANIFKEDDLRGGYREVYHALKTKEGNWRVILKEFRLDLTRRGLLE